MEPLALTTERPTTSDLLDECRRGSREAMHTLYVENQRRVFSIAFNFFNGDCQKAEDVTQQVFLTLLRRMDFRGDSQFTTWLYRITVNQCIDETRRSKRLLNLADWFTPAEPVSTGSLTDRFQSSELSAEVRVGLATLKPKYRMPIVLKYVEELSYQEIADVLGISIGTVSSRMNRGLKLLAQKLGHLRDQVH
jgi:RNA polymerase sigma-70 factor (ECF subfamily)